MSGARTQIFVSYSHADGDWLKRLQVHLKPLERAGSIEWWDDTKILPGMVWRDEIEKALNAAAIGVLLVSADFMATDYCWEIEMKRAMERHEKKEARVIPIIIRDCKWDTAPFAKLNGLPRKGKPIDLWTKKDTAWREVAEGIEKVAKELRKKKKAQAE